MFVLLVTWFAFNQAPRSYQSSFASERACQAAKQQLIGEAQRLKADSDREVERLAQRGTISNPIPPPTVTAVCARR